MLRLAWHNLFQKKARLVASTGGVALALSLMLMLDAVFEGVEGQLTAYMDNSGADVFVSQAGVRTMHMAASWLPVELGPEIGATPGVTSVTPLLYLSSTLKAGDKSYAVYILGIPPDAQAGKPWRIAEGSSMPDQGETVLDRNLADNLGLKIGDGVKVLGREFKITGLSAGTNGLISSIVFISKEDFARIRDNLPVVSYFLVKVGPGEAPEAVAGRVEAAIPGITAQTRTQFASQERKFVKDMGADVISIMNLIGFVIGLAIMVLTVYIATFSRRREYGLMKALGTRNAQLYRLVLAQVLTSVAIGFAVGMGLTLLLSLIAPLVSPNLTLAVSGAAVIKVALVSLLIAALSAFLPIRQIARLEPAIVFK